MGAVVGGDIYRGVKAFGAWCDCWWCVGVGVGVDVCGDVGVCVLV